jgi:hypothetical protein
MMIGTMQLNTNRVGVKHLVIVVVYQKTFNDVNGLCRNSRNVQRGYPTPGHVARYYSLLSDDVERARRDMTPNFTCTTG